MKMLKLMFGVMTGIFLMGLVAGCGTTTNNLSVSSSSAEANTRLLYNFATPPTTFASDANTILLFHMDESAGTVVADASGNLSNGTTVAAPVFNTSGRFSNAVSLNGTTQFVTVTNNANMALTNKLTVEAWVMPRSILGVRTIVSKWGTAGNLSWSLQLSAANPRILLSNNGTTIFTFTSTAALVVNQWAHIAAVMDGSFASIYVNGVLAGKFLFNSPIYNGTAALRVGADHSVPAGFNFFGGLIDEVRVKKDAAITLPVVSSQVDASVNSIYGQLVGSIENAVSPIDAYYLALSGTAQFVQATSPALSIQGPWSVEATVRTTTITTPQNIVVKGTVAAPLNVNYGIQISGTAPAGRVRVFFNDDFANVYEVYSVTQIATNTWYRVAGTWDGNTLRVYVNGNLEGAVTYGSGITPALNGVGMNIGRDSAGTNSFTGHIDRVRISDIARTSFLQ